MKEKEKNYNWISQLAKEYGSSLFGVADIKSIRSEFLLSKEELSGIDYGISLGIILSRAVLDGIIDRPTLLYKWHYRQANNHLDRLAFLLTQELLKNGYRALPIPASQIVDWEEQKGHLSHRMIAQCAGLGWRGRNNLLVHPQFGAQLRLVTILTDLPLKTDKPLSDGCDQCYQCIALCPAKALGENAGEYDLERCYKQLQQFSKQRGIGQHICGICVRVCSGNRSRMDE